MHAAAESAFPNSAVAGVIVTYNPPPGLSARLRAVLRETDFVVVFDNGSTGVPAWPDLTDQEQSRIHLIPSRQNIGLAAALNRGIAFAQQQGATCALLLDHDSTPQPGMVDRLRAAVSAHPRPVAAVAPTIAYAHPDIRCRWPQSNGARLRFRFVYAAKLRAPAPVDLAISSGMLVDIGVWSRVGRFDEALFIDLVDTEFCLRARAHGYDILVAPDATLHHHLGDVRKRSLLGVPMFPTHHHPMRHYYISRNRVVLTRRFALRYPNWFFYEMMSAVKLVTKVALFEPERARKLWNTIRGTWDGLRMALHDRRRLDA